MIILNVFSYIKVTNSNIRMRTVLNYVLRRLNPYYAYNFGQF